MTKKTSSARVTLNERGAIATLPILFTLIVSALGVFGYLKLSFETIGRVKSKRLVEEVVFNVANRLTSLLSQQNTAGCAFATEISNIRNFQNLNPITVDQSYAPVKSLACVLDNGDEMAILQSLQVTLTPLPSPNDLTSLSRLVRVRVIGRSWVEAAHVGETSHATVDRLIRLSVASLGRHVLVLTGPASGPKINLTGGAKLIVYGTTYVASQDATIPMDLDQFVNGMPAPYNSQAVFTKPVFTRSKTVRTTTARFSQRAITTVFNGGIEAGLYSDIPLPIYSATSPTVWQKNIDYHWVYSKCAPGGVCPNDYFDMSPLPEVPGQVTEISDDYKFDAKFASTTTIPDPNVIVRVSETCDSTSFDRGDMKPMVVLRANDTFTIDFTKSLIDPRRPGDRDMFCGLVRAKKLVIISRSANTTLYGRFFADTIEVRGSGTVQLVDPDSAAGVPANLEPPQGGFTLLRRQLKGLEVYLGEPFFLPLARDPAATFGGNPALAAFLPRDVDWPFLTSCPSDPTSPPCHCRDTVANLCWPDTLSSTSRDVTVAATPSPTPTTSPMPVAGGPAGAPTPAPTPAATPLPIEILYSSGAGGASGGLVYISEVML